MTIFKILVVNAQKISCITPGELADEGNMNTKEIRWHEPVFFADALQECSSRQWSR